MSYAMMPITHYTVQGVAVPITECVCMDCGAKIDLNYQFQHEKFHEGLVPAQEQNPDHLDGGTP